MKPRTEIACLGASLLLAFTVLLAAPPAHAQPAAKVARIGFLAPGSASPGAITRAVAKALHDLGYIDGKNAVFEFRFAELQTDKLAGLAAELVRQDVDVIVAMTNVAGVAAKKATHRVPIVVWGFHGAVETGLVSSLARPGGNVTGIESLAPELDAKRLGLLKEVAPGIARLGVVYNPDDPGASFHLASLCDAARALGVAIAPIPAKTAGDIDSVLTDAVAASIDALLTITDSMTLTHWGRIAAFASKHRLPTVCEFKPLAQFGCLVSSGPSFDEFTAGVARQVDRILKGAKAADLPVERATRFEMLVNIKTAKALGITVSRSVLVRADEVIE